MAGYVPFQVVRPILHRGPPPMPVVDIALVHRPVPKAVAVKPVRSTQIIAPEVVAKIVAMRETGDSYVTIRNTLGVSVGTIARYARNVLPPPGGWKTGSRPPAVRNRAKAERMRRAGFSYAEIGADLGCAARVIRSMLLNLPDNNRFITTPIGRIIAAVSRTSGVPVSALRKARAGRIGSTVPNACRARSIVFWLARQRLGGASLYSIGQDVGGFHHSSVLTGVKRVNRLPGITDIDLSKAPAVIARRIWALDWSGSSE